MLRLVKSILGYKKRAPSAPPPQRVIDTGETEAVDWEVFWDKERDL